MHSLRLVPYTNADDRDLFACWQDEATQRGFNHRFTQAFAAFSPQDVARFPFWVTIVDAAKGQRVGTIRLGLDGACPDVAIWMYPRFRHQGYGTQAMCLALRHLLTEGGYAALSAGCYEDNAISRRMLEKCGFSRRPEEDVQEISCFTGAPLTQLAFRITREALPDRILFGQ